MTCTSVGCFSASADDPKGSGPHFLHPGHKFGSLNVFEHLRFVEGSLLSTKAAATLLVYCFRPGCLTEFEYFMHASHLHNFRATKIIFEASDTQDLLKKKKNWGKTRKIEKLVFQK